MTKETRIQKIAETLKEEPYGRQDIPWQGDLRPMDVFKVPLSYLIYNKYNGRILSRTKSLESQGREINPESAEGRELLERLLMESNPSRNKHTLDSIKTLGQEKVGIITRDGIIIDGNRRALLLGKAGKTHFKTVVLPVTLEQSPLEIEKLETSYQMGEDEKLGYNPIEKYLKAKGLKSKNVPVTDIAAWMGEQEGTINEYLKVMGTMDDYLDYLGCNGIYTQLDGREDQFINLTKWTNTFYGETSGKAFDGYRDVDVDDLKLISFDYIRVQYEGKDFRNLAFGLKENHFFGDKLIWRDFRDYHFKHVRPLQDAEGKVKLDSENLDKYLEDRNEKFLEKSKDAVSGKSFFEENIDVHVQQVRNKKSANQPLKLVTEVIATLGAINQHHSSFTAPDVMSKVAQINETTQKMLHDKSPSRLLSKVISILESIDLDNVNPDDPSLLPNVKQISKLAYQLEKSIKKLD